PSLWQHGWLHERARPGQSERRPGAAAAARRVRGADARGQGCIRGPLPAGPAALPARVRRLAVAAAGGRPRRPGAEAGRDKLAQPRAPTWSELMHRGERGAMADVFAGANLQGLVEDRQLARQAQQLRRDTQAPATPAAPARHGRRSGRAAGAAA
ncbi:unnamed protein product, partial [Prorocentrum cordatum]